MPRGVRRTKTVAEGDVPVLTEKNTKEELLTAYGELSSRLQEAQAAAVTPKAAEEETRRQETVVQTAVESTVDKIVRDMAELKLRQASAVDELTRDLVAARERFENVQEAVQIEKQRLEELYDIRVAADTLALLVREHEEKSAILEREHAERKAALEREHAEGLSEFQKTSADQRARFELEMAQAREAWKREQETHAGAVKERDARLAREREREEEEYAYTLKRTRDKDEDDYRQRRELQNRELTAGQEKQERELAAIREKQERELGERERAVAEREGELARLREEAAQFAGRMEAAVKQAAEEATRRAEEKASLAATLSAKEAETAATLAKIRVETLEKTMTERDARITELRTQLDRAMSKVNDIAVKAIEGASGTHALKAVNEIALEQARHPTTPQK